MSRYIAFLRGINLGKRRLPMRRLKGLFEDLGFEKVETFIASGNVVFSSDLTDTRGLESRIARHLEAALGYRVDTFVRTAEEVAAIGRARVFPQESDEGAGIYVGFFQEGLPTEVATKLAAVRTAEDELRVVGREYYWLCRVRSSDSKLWASPQIKALRLPTSTMRNLSSIRKLISKHIA